MLVDGSFILEWGKVMPCSFDTYHDKFDRTHPKCDTFKSLMSSKATDIFLSLYYRIQVSVWNYSVHMYMSRITLMYL